MVSALIRSQTVLSASQSSVALPLQPQVAAYGDGSYAIAFGATAKWFAADGLGLVISQLASIPQSAAYGSAVSYISGGLGPNLQNDYGNNVFIWSEVYYSVNLDANNPYDFEGNWVDYSYQSLTRANDNLSYYDNNNQTKNINDPAIAPVSYYGNPASSNNGAFSIDIAYYAQGAYNGSGYGSDENLMLFNAYSDATYIVADLGSTRTPTVAPDLVQLGGPVASNLAISYVSSTGPQIIFTDVNGDPLHTESLPTSLLGRIALASPGDSGNLAYAYSNKGIIYFALEVGASNSWLAQPLYTTAQTPISPNADTSVSPAIAALPNGDVVVVWLDQTTGFIEGQLLNSWGALLGTPFQVSAGNDVGAMNPAVTGLANGNFVVTWVDVNGALQTAQQSLFSTKSAQVVPCNFAGSSLSGILWRNANGTVDIWDATAGASTSFSDRPVISVGSDWQIAGVGDFNGSGVDGLLWRNADGDVTTWNALASAPEAFSGYGGQTYNVGSDWQIAGVGDFSGEGLSDILWRNASGMVSIWNAIPGSYGAFSFQSPMSLGPDWQVAGVGDFNGSGVDGVLWRNVNDGSITTWNALASAPESFTGNGGQTYDVNLDWQVAGVGDFNGDGRTDILWRNSTTGDTEIWLANANSSPVSFTALSAFSVGLDWGIASLGDYNGDGKSDILWRNATTGDVLLWQSNDGPGISFTATDLGGVGSDWGIVART